MSSNTSQNIKSYTTHQLRANAHDYEPLLAVPDEFTYWDTDLERREFQRLAQGLKAIGALDVVGQKRKTKGYHDPDTNTSKHIVNVYRWVEEAKTQLQDVLEYDETLPCGHRVHIKNHGDGTYGCRYCDEERHYSRETIENRL